MARRSEHSGRTALITGASSGIGAELARCFAKGGFDLVLVARSADKLRALASELEAAFGVAVRVQPSDLSQPNAAAALPTRQRATTEPMKLHCTAFTKTSKVFYDRFVSLITLQILFDSFFGMDTCH